MATLTTTPNTRLQPNLPPPAIIPYAVGWHILIAILSVLVALRFLEIDLGYPEKILGISLPSILFYEPGDFYNLGDPVQIFAGLFLLLPAVVALYSSYGLLTRNPSGRYLGIALNFTGAVLSVAVLFNIWNFYIGMDSITGAILDNLTWTWGIALGYALYWLAGRFDEDSDISRYLEMAGAGLGMLSLIGLLLMSGLLGVFSDILGTYTEPGTIAVTLAIIIFAVIAYTLLNSGTYFGETTGQREAWQGWMMLAPNMLGFAIFFAGPLLLSFYLSFTNAQVGQVPEVIGLDNYIELIQLEVKSIEDGQLPGEVLSPGYRELTRVNVFGSRIIGATDPLFWISLRNTIVFCLLLVPFSTIPALLLANILNSKIPGMKFFRAIYFLPSVAAVVGTALIWRWLYDPIIGYYNYFITEITSFLGVADPNFEWLNNRETALPAVVLLAAWQVVGFNTVLFLAGLQGIPKILYEAAYVDGASRWQQFRKVTLPMLAPTTFFVVITTVIQGLQVFNEIFAMFPARPVPEHVMTSVYYLYDRGFFRFQFGYASSVAWMLFALIFAITLIQFRLSRSSAYED